MLEEILLEILEAFIETLWMLPVLYLVYLLIGYFEHKFLKKKFKFGPLLGATLGSVPQCGFSAVMSDLYSKRMITIGTLIAVFVATSDEAIPIMIANPQFVVPMLWLVAIKFVAAVGFGYIIDLLLQWLKKRNGFSKAEKDSVFQLKPQNSANSVSCEKAETRCHCHHNLFIDALWHALKIAGFIFAATAILNVIIYFVGIEQLETLFGGNVYLEIVFAALIGMIPSCAGSVFVVELYMSGAMSFAALLAGLSAGAGVGFLILIRKNGKRWKENIAIIVMMFAIGLIVGIIFSFVPVWF